ncbi:hypothetical protein DN748_05595 [Sinomicrobium soli]|nr:hypothetical protein DN748_05595 [Sinomicrobium sp. N-1-3-6]
MLFGIFFKSPAQQQELTFRNYTVEEGLVSNTIWSIGQDSKGYMWFGTKNGLSRFDGYEFKSYQLSNKQGNSLGSNFIHALFWYDNETLWLGTTKGIYILDVETDTFTRFAPLKKYLIYDIQKARDGSIWIATQQMGVFRYDPGNGDLANYHAGTKDALSLSSNEIRKLAIDNDGNVWMATFGSGINFLDVKQGYVKHYCEKNTGLSSDFILTIYQDRSERIWAGTLGGGLCLWQPRSRTFKVYSKDKPGSINDNIVRSVYQTGPNTLYIGTERGLNVMDLTSEKVRYYTHKANTSTGIGGNSIYSIFRDKGGGIWLGTYFGGISYIEKNDLDMENHFPTEDGMTLNGGAVSCFLEDAPGKFWIGTEDGGLNYFDSGTGTFRHYPFQDGQEPLTYHNIHSLYKDKEGRLWIGTFSGGLNVYDKKTGRVKVYRYDPDDPRSLSSNNVFRIYEDRDGVIWVGTTKGLNIYDKQTDSFRRITKMGMGHTFVSDIYEDETGTIWFATFGNGLVAHRKKSGTWKQYRLGEVDKKQAVGNLICLLDDHAGNLWLGTEGLGLVRFDFRSETFAVFDEKDGIDANVAYGILQDENRTLWVSTNNGLYHFDPQSRKTEHFTQWDDLQSRQFNYNSSYKASDGKMFFGGIKGFNAFYPEKIKSEPLSGNIVFTNFQLFNKDIRIGHDEGILTHTIDYTDHITLAHGQSVMSFEYAALNFKSPQKVKYAYKMQGFDEHWNYVGVQRKATYTNLPPGEYTFMVKAGYDGKEWSTSTARIGIEIAPPFYLHPLAYLAYGILALVVFFTGRRMLMDRAEKRNRIRLERLSVEQEKQFYNQKIEFFTTMAHEIRTPISLITAPLEKIMESGSLPGHINRQLEIMDENSKRLINLVNQLLDFRRIESDIYEIRKEKLDLVVLVQSIYSRFSAMKYQKKIRFTLSTKVSHLPMRGDPEALTKIFTNLLINAFKFTRSEIRISIQEPVTDESGQSYALATIKDDGIGIPETELQNIFKKYFKVSGDSPVANFIGTGIGLSLAKSLIEKHEGYLEVESVPDVNTIFKIYLPCEEVHTGVYPDPAEAREDRSEESEGEEESAMSENILVVEDDELLLDFFCHNLVQEGFRVQKARNGREAWEVIGNREIDFVLSDVMMPEMDGLELCRKIKSTSDYSHIPVVLLTAKTNSEAEISGIQNGADAYIAKPFKWKYVIAVVQNLLRSRAGLREKFANYPFIDAGALVENTGEKKLLEKITAIIEERIMDPKLSVEELSRELGMSRSSLHKKLKSVSGKVPNEFIRLVRLKHAAKLLLQNEYTISEIGYMSGFNSHSYFSKCFFKQFRITPTDFLEKNGNPQEC